MMESRLFFIDNIRTLLICLVIMVHAAVTYGAEGGWYYSEATNSEVTSIILTIFNAINQSFFMSLLFLFAGYFTIDSATKTAPIRYVLSRLNRLGIPLLAFYVGVGPLTIYISGTLYGSVFNYQNSFHAGPMWFAQALLIFTALFFIASGLRRLFNFVFLAGRQISQPSQISTQFPVWSPIILFILLLWFTTIPTRALWPMGEGIAGMQLGSFAHYSFMFLVGILIYGQDWAGWLNRVPTSKIVLITIACILIMPLAMFLGVDPERGFDYFMGGLSWQAIFYAAWESTMCVMMSLCVVKYINKISAIEVPLLKKMARANYGVYIFHPPVLLMTSWLLMDVTLHPLLKFITASGLTIIICFPIAYLLTRLPVIRKVL